MSEKPALDAGPDVPQSDSVFDFLYHDSRRVGSFLAQLDAGGHLQQVRESDSESRNSSTMTAAKGEGGVPPFGSAGLTHERAVGKLGTLSQERVYDPLWANACSFLDLLQEKGIIRRELIGAGIGQFVLLSGPLTLLDLSVAKSFWNVSQIQELMLQGMLSGLGAGNSQARRQAEKERRDLLKMTLTLLERMPHGLQMRISVSTGELVWSGLQPEFLTGSSVDIAFKHGIGIPGMWNVLGILDALPDSADVGAGGFDAGASIGSGEVIAKFMTTYVPIMRAMMGRPSEAYGITPLLIFREIGKS